MTLGALHRARLTSDLKFLFRAPRCDRNGKAQSVVISGESGAGKTEAAKFIINYMFKVAQLRTESTKVKELGHALMQHMHATSIVLESFGNAKTLRNNNSSRFGKYTELQFDEFAQPIGATTHHYLLEKTRVVTQAPGERSYHIFYQMLAGVKDELREKLYLMPPPTYRYLNQTARSDEVMTSSGPVRRGSAAAACYTIKGVDDEADWVETCDALIEIGIKEKDILQILKLLSAVLLLGNVTFVNVDGVAQLEPEGEQMLVKVCDLLGITFQLLKNIFLIRIINITRGGGARGSEIRSPTTLIQAESARDSLAKHLYAHLFDWMLDKINQRSHSEADCTHSIGILDIYGFEIFEHNSLEQLCINYANEKLQHGFITQVFVTEQDEYRSEGIEWNDIFYDDNSHCVALIDNKVNGILPLLDEQCKFGDRGSDENWLGTLFDRNPQNPCLSKPRRQRNAFNVHHYAGEVTYEIKGCLEKDKESVQHEVIELMKSSSVALVKRIFKMVEKHGDAPTAGTKCKNTVGSGFRAQLSSLSDRLNAAERHYVRTFKPNSQKKPDAYENTMIVEQLKSNGVPETMKDAEWRARDPRDNTWNMMSWTGIAPGTSTWQLGNTKLFIKTPDVLAKLDDMKEKVLREAVVATQKFRRGKAARKSFLDLRVAAKIVQSSFRKVNDRRRFLKMKRDFVKIHACGRRLTAMSQYKKMHRGFIRLQATHRMRRDRKQFLKDLEVYRRRLRLLRGIRAVTVLQSKVRMRKDRQAFTFKLSQICRSQRYCRRWQARQRRDCMRKCEQFSEPTIRVFQTVEREFFPSLSGVRELTKRLCFEDDEVAPTDKVFRTNILVDGTSITKYESGREVQLFPGGERLIIRTDKSTTQINPDGLRLDKWLYDTKKDASTNTSKNVLTIQSDPDGVRIVVRPITLVSTTFLNNGRIVTLTADGSTHQLNPDGKVIEMRADKTQVQTMPDGSALFVSPDGTQKAVPRKKLKMSGNPKAPEGERAQKEPKPCLVVHEQVIKDAGDERIVQTLQDGRVLTIYNDGVIMERHPDARTIQYELDGATIETLTDGRVVTTEKSGEIITQRPDGVTTWNKTSGQLITRFKDGRIVQVNPDGTRIETSADLQLVSQTNPDGTKVQRDKQTKSTTSWLTSGVQICAYDEGPIAKIQTNPNGKRLQVWRDGRRIELDMTKEAGKRASIISISPGSGNAELREDTPPPPPEPAPFAPEPAPFAPEPAPFAPSPTPSSVPPPVALHGPMADIIAEANAAVVAMTPKANKDPDVYKNPLFIAELSEVQESQRRCRRDSMG
ncbi:hypothetical protein CYMTET_12138 [Cymbomonas tetramitiformis]|uniref:Myosin motor domain-containing protein n=1 Tax=Cymbomonas tetramitiformis TaxID=36881 RepID=A0AAE0GL71_9CHLO|nr:hypothetical protein CYMTET_12138 [Cymbomonas tetramitiformis]